MNVYEIFNNWGINMPNIEHLADACMTYLYEKKEKNLYYIDKLPFTVGRENANKLYQMELLYEQVIQGNISKNDFLKLEKKYKDVINKLWLYNKTFIEFVIPDVYVEKPDAAVEKKYKPFLSLLDDIEKQGKLFEVNQKEELEFWVQLGIRGATCVAFYLEDYKAIIVPSWSCFIMYLHDIKYYQIIKDIVISEGLFLRHRL